MRLKLDCWGIHVSFQRVATVRITRVRTGGVANDPELSAPGKLAKNRRCKSPTGKV